MKMSIGLQLILREAILFCRRKAGDMSLIREQSGVSSFGSGVSKWLWHPKLFTILTAKTLMSMYNSLKSTMLWMICRQVPWWNFKVEIAKKKREIRSSRPSQWPWKCRNGNSDSQAKLTRYLQPRFVNIDQLNRRHFIRSKLSSCMLVRRSFERLAWKLTDIRSTSLLKTHLMAKAVCSTYSYFQNANFPLSILQTLKVFIKALMLLLQVSVTTTTTRADRTQSLEFHVFLLFFSRCARAKTKYVNMSISHYFSWQP